MRPWRLSTTSRTAHVDDLHAAVALLVLRIHFGTIPRLGGTDAGPSQSAATVDRRFQNFDDADGALARKLVVVLVLERFEPPVVGVPDHQHTTRNLVHRLRNPL